MTQAWNFPAMQAAVADLQGSHTRIKGLLDECQGALATLQSSWQGSGNESYAAVQQRFNQNTENMNSALNDLSQAIGHSAEAMQQTETGVAGMFGG
ncbi:WXG100 family type VII secretion target [Mycobacterium haemophilum]|uniref:ESAT-6-like protein n=1 Tax=Mycobacterium haemophilum TaxID=29311 RepID=A0A0I9TWD8_9MYCO|nr:WXG100 family type VII secretion target [Mycobacterium haemophilum]KLO25526.1 early secretory antigenic target-like protein [Mycobacterium haemophilum]KLO34086.1 early secretory antigenic target-like protein [Mycobacterium haemophilum]KLO35906.1 early secretory antigenic target-like protein [Mycobacterium haemophilum]KLO43863.1 early secretory antigenic target-like protein [Mycobacterium haemophilum]